MKHFIPEDVSDFSEIWPHKIEMNFSEYLAHRCIFLKYSVHPRNFFELLSSYA